MIMQIYFVLNSRDYSTTHVCRDGKISSIACLSAELEQQICQSVDGVNKNEL